MTNPELDKDKERTKISIDEIVNQKDIILIRSIECPIDNMVPLEAHAELCKKCQTLYCVDCIQVWQKTSNICPMRCSPMHLIKVQGTIVGQQLQAIKIKCKYEPFGCEEKVLLKDHKKHEKDCDFRQEQCPACGETKCHYLLVNHLLKECDTLKIQCFVCSNKYFLGEINSHIKSCLEINLYCNVCNSYYNKNIDHSNKGEISVNRCRLLLSNCDKCNLPELNYLIGTPEHICQTNSSNNQISLNNYLLQLSVRVHVSMEKALKDRQKTDYLFFKDFDDRLSHIKRIYFNMLYNINSKKKKIGEDYKRRIQTKSNHLKENIGKIENSISTLNLKMEGKPCQFLIFSISFY